MSELSVIAAPTIKVWINGKLLGMVQSFRTEARTAPVVIRSFGKSAPAAVAEGERDYTVTLRRLVLGADAFPNQTPASGLRDFSLSLNDGVVETTFTGCYVTSESTSYEAGKLVIEELVLRASGRAWSQLE